ncbi:hypothetical protein BH10PSE19_BH10PSE19_03360 [soil metagenome]
MSVQAKLTLRLNQTLIEHAKKIAASRGRSLSQMVADYFKILEDKPAKQNKGEIEITPLVRALRGSLQGNPLDETDYYKHLENKYL